MINQYIIKELKQRFDRPGVFHREELLDFYRGYDSTMTDTELSWRIFELKKKGIIETVKKGIYRLGKRKPFRPTPDDKLLVIGTLMHSFEADGTAYCCWKTNWLNEFIELQVTSIMTIVETEKDIVETVFYHLRDKGFNNVFFKPDEVVLDKYISELNDSIIIKPMISRSPLSKINNFRIATLEKILVDLLCDEKLYFAFQGSQLVQIYSAAIEKYSINFTKLLNYAKRRNRDDELKEFLMQHLQDHIKDLI